MVGKSLWVVAMAFLLFVSVACMPIKPPAETPVPEEETTETATVVAEESEGLQMVLTGTVTYRQRIALPAGSVIEVQLQDVAATVIASQTITTTGENVPIPFELTYDPAEIDARMSYALSVRITVGGQLRWINTERYTVLTIGAPMTGVEVVVQPAR